MTRNQWSRWGRGSCVGYSLSIGDGYTRFHGSVSRSVPHSDGSYTWSSAINGICTQTHPSIEEAMARVEHELSIAGEAFASAFADYKTHRPKSKFSQAVDAMRATRQSASLITNGTP